MPTRCGTVAGQSLSLPAGTVLIPGTEVTSGGLYVTDENGNLVWQEAPYIVGQGDIPATAGDDGAVVIWPDTGNDQSQYSPGENVPVGTTVNVGWVYDNGEWHEAPPTYEVTGDGAEAGPPGWTDYGYEDNPALSLEERAENLGIDLTELPEGSDENRNLDDEPWTDEELEAAIEQALEDLNDPTKNNLTQGEDPESEEGGFCDEEGRINFPTEEDEDFLSQFLNYQMPQLNFWNLTGFVGWITKQLTKLSALLARFQSEVDKILGMAQFNPEDICKPPVPQTIEALLDLFAWLLKVMMALKKILQLLNTIMRLIKIAIAIIKWVFSPMGLVTKFLDLLNVTFLIDMVVSVLFQTVAKFVALIPILQAQLLAILAGCRVPDDADPDEVKQDCEKWVSDTDLEKLQQLYDQIVEAAGDLTTPSQAQKELAAARDAAGAHQPGDTYQAGGTTPEPPTNAPGLNDPALTVDLSATPPTYTDEDENIWLWDEDAQPPSWVLDTAGPGSGNDCYAVDRNGISQNFGDDCDAAAGFAEIEAQAYRDAAIATVTAEVGVCTVDAMNNLTEVDCIDAGGQWLTGQDTDDIESVDKAALAAEFARVAAELDRCFADPDIANFMGDI